MSLFKILRGAAARLKDQAKIDGWAWLTPDDGAFYIDAANEVTGEIERIHINPKSSTVEATLVASNWVSTSDPLVFTYNLTSLPTITAATNGIIELNSVDPEVIKAVTDVEIMRTEQGNGFLIFSTRNGKPSTNIPLKILIIP